MTIDYKKPTKYSRSVAELIEFLLWTTCTPGKSSEEITPKFNALCVEHSPLDVIQKPIDEIKSILKDFKIGQYTRISKAWDTIGKASIGNKRIISGKFLEHAPRDHFTIIPGLGMKTASFFIMSNRKWAELATLDTHILKWLAREFPMFKIPKVTPSNKHHYVQVEALFVGAASMLTKPDGQPYTCAELDLAIWKEFSANN
jgi:thermostable 8-oxoguanine DNA glycosylase